MRVALSIAAVATAALLPLQLALAGGESPRARPSADPGPRHELLGGWRAGRDLSLRVSARNGVLHARATRRARVGPCTVRRGAVVLRGLRFARRDKTDDVWEGRSVLPGPGCRRVVRQVEVVQSSDLAASVAIPGARDLRLRRVRPRPRAGDSVLAVWERNQAGVEVALRDGRYIGRAREDFLISNGCVIPARTVVWRLRPSAPGRYDGTTRTFAPPPGCSAVGTAPSRWRLTEDGSRLVREAPDGSLVEYERAP